MSIKLAWGNRVSTEFRSRVVQISAHLKVDPSFLMAAIAFETGQTFRADIHNGAGSGAVGLIQFMPQTAAALGTSSERLAEMSPVRQLDYVRDYLEPKASRLKTIEDVYMAILWPSAIGKPSDYVLFKKHDLKRPRLYIQNAGLDFNKDGVITKREAAARVVALLDKGLQKPNVFDV